ncbi:major pollen allergen Ole e 10 [Andrographis paniculata]|uniref:major pollen allergen Ole e 10 n=1 Tax=Andrographis paniculata TaxID=175694 RepID=UPI0021E8191B|nr:major pollen allergen Ole e 10 [Andrographis paniculata]
MKSPFFFVLLLFLNIAAMAANNNNEDDQKTWCVAKASAEESVLMANIDYACSQPGVDCATVLRKGCPCFTPDTLLSHASLAMNLYYQSTGRNQWNCYFANSGLIVITDPSYGSCIYQ